MYVLFKMAFVPSIAVFLNAIVAIDCTQMLRAPHAHKHLGETAESGTIRKAHKF